MKKWQFVGTTALGATLLLGACGGGNGGSGNSDLKGKLKGWLINSSTNCGEIK